MDITLETKYNEILNYTMKYDYVYENNNKLIKLKFEKEIYEGRINYINDLIDKHEKMIKRTDISKEKKFSNLYSDIKQIRMEAEMLKMLKENYEENIIECEGLEWIV